MFRNFGKIYHIGKEEVDGILNGHCVLQEKIDGANTSIWCYDGIIRYGSRTRDITDRPEQFSGFISYIERNDMVKDFLIRNRDRDLVLYGEWLSKHTIPYKESAYGKFYLFDIYERATDKYWNQKDVAEIAEYLSLDYAQVFKEGGITMEDVELYAGKTNLGKVGEGVVIKNLDFVNKFGNSCYAKYVTKEFKEDNGIIFGNNNKSSECYNEQKIVNKYITLPRVKKAMNKIQVVVDERLWLNHTSRICSSVYNDMLVEEIWSIQKEVSSINFKTLQRIVYKKVALLYKEILNDNVF